MVQELHLFLHMAHKVNMLRLARKLLGFLLQKQMLKHFKGFAITEPILNIGHYEYGWGSSWSNLIKEREKEVDGEQHN